MLQAMESESGLTEQLNDIKGHKEDECFHR